MSRSRQFWKRSGRFLVRYSSQVVFVIALLLLGLSYIRPDYEAQLRRQKNRVERSLHKRELLAERYTLKALEASDQDWIDFDDLPDDIVLYCYQSDTMKSWTHQFPISNDEVDVYPYSYRLQYMSNRNLYATPLAYIGLHEKYVNLGSAWYVVTTHFTEDRSFKVVTGILVKTEYPGSTIPNVVNKHLRLSDGYTTVAINDDDTAIVYGIEDEPLFSVVPKVPPTPDHGNMPLRWLAFALMVSAAFVYHSRYHTWRSFWMILGVLAAVRLLAHYYVAKGYVTGELFSPILYADTTIFNSLGSLLLNNVVVALGFYSLFVMRYRIHKRMESHSPLWRWFGIALLILAGLGLVLYIHFVLRSLLLNSGIPLEPYRLADFNLYGILVYASFAMLFLALLYQIYLVVMIVRRDARINLFSWSFLALYVLIIATYCEASISRYGLVKEYESNRVNTSKLNIERDLSLEMFLREVEPSIQNDPFLSVLTSVNASDLIRNRLMERYLYSDVVHNYDITLTICTPNNLISLGQATEPVGCFPFYENMIKDYGVALASGSNIYYLHNYNGLASYLGMFTYFDPGTSTVSRLFLELESKFKNDVLLNPFDAITSRTGTAATLSRFYSYARYSDDRLVAYGGSFNYPVNPPVGYESGYQMVNKDGYIHFVNRLSDEDITVISRPRRPFLPHLISFSYLGIFFGFFLLLFTRRWRKDKLFNLPKHSLKRKITLLITISMVLALGTMGIGSVVYVMRLNRENAREEMDGVMRAAQTSLAEPCKYALRYNELNTSELYNAMDEFARITQSDLNLYNIHGELIRSTKPELFDQFLVGKRMNNRAFRQIVKQRQLRFVDLETIAGIRFYDIYEPVFNGDGTMVAIASVPYFNRSRDVTDATASTVSAVINIYLLLLFAAIALGAIISNSISRPLVEIRDRIGSLALTGNRRIRYRNSKDELGVLISSYNKMVEDLEESTRQLAQSEREQAWKEMARQIAHEIKNPLTPMKLSIQYLMKLKEAGVPGWEDKFESVSKSLLEQIDTLSQTATEFSSFARFFSEDITRVDLDALIQEQKEFFDNREDVQIEYCREGAGEAFVDARRSQLARVLVNLITNAIQALDSVGMTDGLVRVSLAPVQDGAAWQIDVEDNGPGVSEEDLPKLFTPNFTTKKTGTGLGLAICRSIIEQSQGTIAYSRSDLGGARFTIVLPKAQ
ncbi:MAG: HAMP domain-containing histidine kinase [Bacteroidales bacterium]|nr:HAMP domain-containing histidine kinase [Bacteroidales bacterium]